jgi:cell division septum initiation protein DivIVA
MRCHIIIAVMFSVTLTAQARGQNKSSQVEDVRRQIDALQKQLNHLEMVQASPAQKVAQLGASRHQRGEPTLIVRVYDLSDLFSIAPAYAAVIGNDLGLSPRPVFPEAAASQSGGSTSPMGGSMGGMGGGLFAIRNEVQLAQTGSGRAASGQTTSVDVAASAKTSLQSLINAIETTIDPESWEALSGPGSIARIGTSLIIRNEAGVHEQVDALFTLLRQKWGTLRTVSISAWWLPLTEQQLAKLLPGNGKGQTGVEGIEAFGIVDAAAWQQIIEADAQADKKASGAWRAAITCYNGQTVSTTAGAEDGIVSDIEPIAARGGDNHPEGRIAFRPQMTPIHEGASLQIAPLVSSSGKFVMLDVHSSVTTREPAPAGRRPAARDDDHGPAAAVAALDRPRLLTQRLATTLRAPVERVMLVGGMTVSAKPQGDEPALYLFLKATVQELRDDARRVDVVKPPQANEVEEPSNDQAR